MLAGEAQGGGEVHSDRSGGYLPRRQVPAAPLTMDTVEFSHEREQRWSSVGGVFADYAHKALGSVLSTTWRCTWRCAPVIPALTS